MHARRYVNALVSEAWDATIKVRHYSMFDGAVFASTRTWSKASGDDTSSSRPREPLVDLPTYCRCVRAASM